MGGAAVVQSTKPAAPFVFRHHARALGFCAFFVLGALLYGYDGTYFAGILNMRPFIDGVGDQINADGSKAISSGSTSLLASIVQVGELVGSLSAGFVGQAVGRRGTLVCACILVSLGSIIQLTTTTSLGVFVGGRFVLGAGIGQISNCVPLYLSEVSNVAIRGVTVGSWQMLLALGQVVGAGVDQGTQGIASSASFRIPIALNFVVPLVVFFFIWFIPESPQWLVSKRRDDKARLALAKINRSQPGYTPDEDFNDIKIAHTEATQTEEGSWWQLITNPIERRKAFCVFGILAGQQLTGVQFIFSYCTVIAEALDIGDPFTLTMIVDVIEVVGVICSFPLIYRYGRKPLILWTCVPMIISLLVVGLMGSFNLIEPTVPTKVQGQVAIAFISIFVFFFNLAIGPLAWSVATEHCTGPNRSRAMSLGTASFWIVAWAVTFTLPYLYNESDGAGLGLKIGYIYAFGTLITMTFVYFYIGETRNRSLEAIDELFRRQIPARKWKGFVTDAELASSGRREDVEVDSTDKKNDKTIEERIEAV